jgi:hypothetical protein
MLKEFWLESLKGRKLLVRISLIERIILKWIVENWDGGMDLIYLDKDRNQWHLL